MRDTSVLAALQTGFLVYCSKVTRSHKHNRHPEPSVNTWISCDADSSFSKGFFSHSSFDQQYNIFIFHIFRAKNLTNNIATNVKTKV